ncbi:MAG: hypothetical protein IK085_06350, partial [Clostridia bacterium]|nr:hypothetical protein [Clostridia bacterium]
MNSEGSEAKPKPNAPVERLPSRSERSEAIKIPSGVPRKQFTHRVGCFCIYQHGTTKSIYQFQQIKNRRDETPADSFIIISDIQAAVFPFRGTTSRGSPLLWDE